MVKPISSGSSPQSQPIQEVDKKKDPVSSQINGQKAGRTITNTNPSSTPGMESDSESEAKEVVRRKVEILLSDKPENIQFNNLDELRSVVKSLYEGENLTKSLRSKLDMQRAELFAKESIPHYNVMIAGAGPAGLMAAIDQAKRGHSAYLSEGRNQDEWDIRSSVMILPDKVTNYILRMLTELEPILGLEHVFSHKLKTSDEHPKSLEKLKSQLESEASDGDGSTLQTDTIQRICVAYAKAKYPKLIHIAHQSMAERFDPWLQVVSLKSSEVIAFDSIIHADGVHGKSRASLAELGITSQYITAPTSMSGRNQCAYLYHPSWTKVMEYGGALDAVQKIPSEFINKFRELGWNKDTFPGTYIALSHSGSKKIWVAGRCPETLQPEQQLEWNKLICEAAAEPAGRARLEEPTYIDADGDTERGRKKAKLSHLMFTVEPRELQNASVDLPFGKSETIGDAREAPDFMLSEGIENAIRDIESLVIPEPYRDGLKGNEAQFSE